MKFVERLEKDVADFLQLRKSLGFNDGKYQPMMSFIKFCDSTYANFENITKEMFDAWIAYKDFRTKGTLSGNISRMRLFLKYHMAMGGTPFIPGDEYSVGKNRYIPYILYDEEIMGLFESIDNLEPCKESPERHLVIPVMFRMMYCCGMRPGEPVALLYEDVNLNTGEVYIRQSKRQKDRRILMSPDLTKLCAAYDSICGRHRNFFFERENGDQYSTRWIRYQFNRCWDNSGLEKRGGLRPYDLRHNFATRTLLRWTGEKRDVNAAIPYLSAYMGHDCFSETLYYIHLIPELLVENVGIDWARFSCIYPEVACE
jgi:integrase